MLSRREHNGIQWIDLESPTHDELRHVLGEFHIDALVGEDLALPSAKPRADFHENYLYLVLHFPALRHTHKSKEQEVDFVIGRNFIVTTHYEMIDPLHKFGKVFEVNSLLEKSHIGDHAGFVFFYMMKNLYKSVEHELEFIRHDLADIENHVFSGEELAMVAAISRTARDLLNLRQTVEPHREILHSIETEGAAFFGSDFMPYLRALSNEYYRVHNHIMRLTESLHELRETNNSLLSTKQSDTMRVLTTMALFTYPLSLIAVVFGMDADHMPIRGLANDFWIMIALMGLCALLMYLYFKYRKWM